MVLSDAERILGQLGLAPLCREHEGPIVDAATGRVATVCNVAVATGPKPVNEPSIAVNPRDPLNLVAGANDYNAMMDVWAGVYVSKDGGKTWKVGMLPGYPGDTRASGLTGFTGAGDAAIAFAPDGTVYYAGIAFKRQAVGLTNRALGGATVYLSEPPTLFIARSRDGGETWDQVATPVKGAGTYSYVSLAGRIVPVLVSLFQDKEYIAVGPDGAVYVTWTSYTFAGTTGTAPILMIKSTDMGATWSQPVTLSRTDDNQGSVPAVAADGTLAVTWGEYLDARTMNVVVVTSQDKGRTFSAPSVLAQVKDLSSTHSTRANTFPSIAADSTGRFTVVWADNSTGDSDVYMAQSSDKGFTWSTPARVNQDPMGNGRDQFFPWVAADPQGRIHIVYFDGRDDPRNQQLSVYVASTLDGSVIVERAVTDAPFFADPDGFTGDNFLGDYLGIAAGPSGVFPIWPDTRVARNSLGDTDLYIARLMPAVASE